MARVDDTPVPRWHIADPEHPERPPTVVAYPAAGTRNARVDLQIIALDGSRTRVRWDAERDEYLVTRGLGRTTSCSSSCSRGTSGRCGCCGWTRRTGSTTPRHEQTDPAWVDIVPGVPAHTAAGALVTTADADGARRLIVDGAAGHARRAAGARRARRGRRHACCSARAPTRARSGCTRGPAGGLTELTPGPGVHSGRLAGGTLVVFGQDLDSDGTTTTVHPRRGAELTIASFADPPGLIPRITLLTAGERELRSALLLPTDHRPGTPLPVLMDPYGGPHGQRVLAARGAHLTSQWFADQGFAVVVVDGRGTPGRGPEFERAVHGDLAGPVLDDQVDALHAVAAPAPGPGPEPGRHPRLVVRRLPGRAGRAAPARTSSTPRSPAPR